MQAILALLMLLSQAAAEAPYPADAFSRPQIDCWSALETLSGVQPAGNPVQRLAQWERNVLRSVQRDGLPWARWEFVCRPGNGAVLCFSDRIMRAPRAVTVRVANRGARPARLAVSMAEIPWVPGGEEGCRNWAVNGDAPVPPGEERVVRFDLAQLRPDRPCERAAPAWPTTINLHVGGPEPGVEYVLELREWTVIYPDAPGVRVALLRVPDGLVPGEEAEFAVQAEGIRRGATVDLELRDRERILWRVRLNAEETEALAGTGRVSWCRPVPWYLPGRELTMGLVVDGYRAAGAQSRSEVDAATSPGFPRVQRRPHGGRPAAFVEGEPLSWSGYSSYDYQPGNVSEFGASGANMMIVPVAAGTHIHSIAAPTWIAPDCYDFSEVDERVCMSLQANPRAHLILRVSLALPAFWLQEHPDSIVRVRTGDDGAGVEWEETGCLAASISSPEWQAQQEACLRALVAHCESQPWAGRVVGFMPTGGVTEEWFAWGCNDGLYADYSPANEAAFAQWSRERGLPWTAVPPPSTRQRPGWDTYPGDEHGRHAADYARFGNELTANVIARFARVIKDATGGRCLVGAFHGYLMQLAGEPRQHLAGHFALGRLLDCPEVDFLAGIPLHNFRQLVGGYDCFTSATESILAAGKLFVNENDLFSWLHHAIWATLYDPQDPRGAAVSMHRRVLADDMVHGVNRQWFSLLASWHHDASLQAEFARQTALQSAALQYDRNGAEEVALVVDDAGFDWTPPETKLPGAAYPGLLGALGRTGAPVGVWLLRDLERLPERVKLVVVASATAARREDLRKLRALLAEGGRTVVVIGAPGLVNRETGRWDRLTPGALLGLPVAIDDQGGPGSATLPGTGGTVCSLPAVRPRAEGAETSGAWLRFSDGAVAGLERDLPVGGRLIWCSVPPQSSALAREWMERAGVHCYAPPGFSIHASRELVAITAAAGVEAVLSWPRPVGVRDLYDGWSAEGRRFSCPFAPGQTRLFSVQER